MELDDVSKKSDQRWADSNTLVGNATPSGSAPGAEVAPTVIGVDSDAAVTSALNELLSIPEVK